MLDRERSLQILEALANGIDPISGEVFSADSPYQQPEVIRALFYAVSELNADDNQGKP